jgi:hypothetical protein
MGEKNQERARGKGGISWSQFSQVVTEPTEGAKLVETPCFAPAARSQSKVRIVKRCR